MSMGAILVATDLSARSDRAIDRAFELGRDLGAAVKVVHVVKPEGHTGLLEELVESRVRETLPELGEGAEILLPEGSPPGTIARVAGEQGAALIVAGVARFNQISDYFLGTAVDYLVRHAEVPVLVVKQRQRGLYRRLLVPSDFSAASKAAVLAAARLFPDAAIRVVHVFHVGFEGWGVADHVMEETLARAEGDMAEFLASSDFADLNPGRIEGVLAGGEPEVALGKAIEAYQPDLVVLGTQGGGVLRQLAVGSRASSLLSWVRPDTLMVRLTEQTENP
ncbi:nucleotide-binding universal stress UspA family protein [Novosphingobium sp. PhB165]|uniref:universal stress protein n=1 Tax=Novosphingobium sp. PhB165 TaxID=2485105 RepID=UPI0010481696|nr:universal stress protein [Novosphingobium sp. PhB165]TCM21726.1 nucleotide-binding universal stress UspA family protein [Novosphingobium sp. PhB165]